MPQAEPLHRVDTATMSDDGIRAAAYADPRSYLQARVPDAVRALRGLGEHLGRGALDARLRRLIELRVSQMHGCAFCCGLHADQARRGGESQARLDALAAWRESPLFEPPERAALAWAEALTRLGDGGVDDALYAAWRAHLSERELLDVTVAVGTTGVWNRLVIASNAACRAGGLATVPTPQPPPSIARV